MQQKIQELLDEQIRPALGAHGGDVELVEIKDNKVYLRLQGGCQGCAGARSTLKDGIERIICAKFPEIVEVVDVTDHSEAYDPYMS